MAKKRNNFDFKNFFIGILILVVASQSYLLLKDRKGKSLSRIDIWDSTDLEKKLVPSSVKITPQEPTKPGVVAVAKKKEPVVAVVPKRTEPPPFQGKIAIIIDDWGYSLESCRALQEIKSIVAVAILPGLKYSKQIATCAQNNHKDVMLHLPMEPHQMSESYPENYIIKIGMSRKQIQAILEKSLATVPFVSGVNNHMGSKVTENARAMKIIFTQLKRKGLFFVDSLVTNKSICFPLAGEMDVMFARRDIFLDNENKRDYIEKQFKELAREAKQKGRAIAIGHDRALTLKIIKEQTVELEKQGFRIVSIKDLLK